MGVTFDALTCNDPILCNVCKNCTVYISEQRVLLDWLYICTLHTLHNMHICICYIRVGRYFDVIVKPRYYICRDNRYRRKILAS